MKRTIVICGINVLWSICTANKSCSHLWRMESALKFVLTPHMRCKCPKDAHTNDFDCPKYFDNPKKNFSLYALTQQPMNFVRPICQKCTRLPVFILFFACSLFSPVRAVVTNDLGLDDNMNWGAERDGEAHHFDFSNCWLSGKKWCLSEKKSHLLICLAESACFFNKQQFFLHVPREWDVCLQFHMINHKWIGLWTS